MSEATDLAARRRQSDIVLVPVDEVPVVLPRVKGSHVPPLPAVGADVPAP